jgi:uncharacterized protein YrrD
MHRWHELETLKGYSLQARDGEIGTITDVWFDDHRWTLRYLVVRTGGWLMGREVLLPPTVIRGLNVAREQIAVDLTREQVEKSPPIDSEQPVSRHYETQLHAHYGWLPYWLSGPFGALGTTGLDAAPPPEPQEPVREPPDPHLRSSKEVRGYRLHARDGDIGELVDFVIHEEDWTIRYLAADTRRWLPGRKVLLAPDRVQSIRWSDHEVAIDMQRETLRTAPAYDGPQVVDHGYEVHLHQHYGGAAQHQRGSAPT